MTSLLIWLSRLGIGVLGMFGAQFLVGILVYANPWCPVLLKQKLMGAHRTFGAISILLVLLVLFTGYVHTY